MLQVNDANFESEVLTASDPVLVDFWAPWCGPCRMLGPVIEELSAEYEGKVKVVKLNVDENPIVSQEFRVASIPTVIFFKNGKAAETLVGFRPKQAFKQVIDRYL